MIVVLGASGGIGGAVVRELAARGHRVRAVGRTPPAGLPEGVEGHAADLATPDGSRRACAGAAVVVHCAQPPYGRWPEEFPALNAAVADGAAAAEARLVVADNLYMYGPVTGPISERSPQRPSSRKGRIRLALAEDLLRRHREGSVRVAIARATDYYGPGGIGSIAGRTLFGDAVAGRPVRWPGDADVPHALAYLPDVARAIAILCEHEEGDGRAWVLPAAPAVTPRAFVGLVADALGAPVRLKPTGRLAMRLAGLFIPEAREIPDIWYQFSRPWEVDGRAFLAAFGDPGVMPHETAVPETVAWWREQGGA